MKTWKRLYVGAYLLIGFALWTAAICLVDVCGIGPSGSKVGFAALNRFVHELTDVNMRMYVITDWLSLIPLGFAVGFAVLGLAQWIGRRNLRKVDRDLIVLGTFYMVVIAMYVIFEFFVVNYRPVLIDGCLEPSYPSSTTVLVTSVMLTAILQLKRRVKHNALRKWATGAIGAYIAFMIAGRLISGVHWFTDIVGGLLLSVGLVSLYRFFE